MHDTIGSDATWQVSMLHRNSPHHVLLFDVEEEESLASLDGELFSTEKPGFSQDEN